MPAADIEDSLAINDHADHSNQHGLRLPTLADQWVPMLLAAWDADIVTVCACPNVPQGIGNYNPGRFGRADNPLITVCRLTKDGMKSPENGRPGPATTSTDADNPVFVGNIDIYAIGEGLALPRSNSMPNSGNAPAIPNSYQYNMKGSSLAVPQIAALASYFAASPQFATLPAGSVSMDRKTQLVKLSRTDTNYDTLGAAYNGVREIWCSTTGKVRPRAQE